MMKRHTIFTIILLLLSSLWAAAEDEFVIGAYSQYQLQNAHQTEEVFSQLAKLLSDAGYNTVLYSMPYDAVKNGRLEAALKALKKYEIKSIIDDWAFEADSAIGVTAMANGSYLKLEAEYHYDANAKTYREEKFAHDNAELDRYNMVFRHDMGRRSEYLPNTYSNGFAWLCDANAGDKAGIALSEPLFRWKAKDDKKPRHLGSDLRFFPSAKENRLYIKVALMWDDLPQDAKVAELKLKVLRKDQPTLAGEKSEDPYLELPLTSVHPELYDSIIINKDYGESCKDPITGAYIFEYFTPIPKRGSQTFNKTMEADYFLHISPTLYWYGKGNLAIDYLELEDELHRALNMEVHPWQAAFDQRLRDISIIPNSQSIIYYYGKDEPLQGQFSTFNKLEKRLEAQSLGLITATNILHSDLQKAGDLPGYFHFGLFLDQADPSIVMLDAYALQEWGKGAGTLLRWNNDLDHRLFIQNKLDDMVLDNYLELARLVKLSGKHSDTKLFFVPQSFGEKVLPLDSGEWLYFMPPLSMQKCLQLLPLCYAADGIIDFAITSNRKQDFPFRDSFYNRLTPITHDANYQNPRTMEDESFLQNLAEANAKIQVYGPLIRKLEWQDAYCLYAKGKSRKPSSSVIKSMQVLNTDKAAYQGYVQRGEYLADDALPTIMLVNRRAVFKKGKPSLVDWKVETAFENAPDQSVRITLNRIEEQAYGLYDPYLQTLYVSDNHVFDITLEAGDGALLQVVPVEYPLVKVPPKRSWFKRLFGIK